MHTPQETHTKNNTERRPIPVSVRWIISLLGVLILLGMGAVFAHNHQPLRASSGAAAELVPFQPGESGQVLIPGSLEHGGDKVAAKPSIWPVSGEVTSGFGWRNSPLDSGSELHAGIDIANSMDTPVVATADGTVVRSEWAGGYGNLVQIDHGNGITTIYGHNSRIIASSGQHVKKGQVIAYVGSTGKSTGPHVHYEIRVNGTAVDPIGFMVQY
ncbi:Peptidase M23 [uncultured Sporomusa sp.]|uniref:Peptidase M23 n=1 Tax=uncultured Sporomusa sp. TaxID=307249 RepID=A0A212LPF7_9FIRM|nr:Peptidase M23 [uncultured Sporomusa sp.]